MEHLVKILDIVPVTHDVKRFRLARPAGFHFTSGQATDVSVPRPRWEKEPRPFTFTALDSDPYLEFTIKRYADHDGVTNAIHQLQPGDELVIREPWGAIEYKGPGYFIAGGAGITPFISIFRNLQAQQKLAGNTLLFSNKTLADVIYPEELQQMLGNQAVFILSRETHDGFFHGRIDEAFLRQHVPDLSKQFYVCGPDEMVQQLTALLEKTGAAHDNLIFEK